MALYYQTILGRAVTSTYEVECDLILKLLYDFHYGPFNPNDRHMTVEALSRASSMDRKRVEDICQYLARQGYVQPYCDPTGTGLIFGYKINGTGVAFVETLGRVAI